MRIRLLVLAVALCAPLAAQQNSTATVEAQSVLHRASSLVPMVEELQRPSVASNVASTQVRAGDVQGALLTLQALASHGDPGLAIDTVAAALAVRGDQQLALKLVETTSRENIRASAYLQMALLLAENGKFDLAVETANRIPESQISAWVDASMRIYLAEAKRGKTDEAAQLLDLVVSRVKNERDDSTLPTMVRAGLCSTAIMYLEQAGNADAAWPLVQQLEAMAENEPHPQQQAYVFSILANSQIHLGNYDAARQIIARLPEGNTRDGVTLVLSMVLTQRGDPDTALAAMSSISLEDWRIGLIRQVADARAASGNYAGALSVIEAMPRAADRAYAFAELALEQAQHNDPAAGYTNELACETAHESPDAAPYVYEYIAVTRAILGDYAGAITDVNAMQDSSRPWVLWNLTDFLVQAGQRDQAYALADAQTLPYAKADALLGIAQALLRTESNSTQ